MRKLDRSLGLGGVVAVSVGAMAGGGLFVLPGIAAGLSGPSLWLAYLVAGLLVLPAALAKAELATALPSSGGTYLFIERSLGPFAGAVSGIGAALSLLLKACFALIGLGSYLALAAPIERLLGGRAYEIVAVATLAAVTLLNAVGVKRVGLIQKRLVAVTIGALAALVVFALPRVRADLVGPQFPHGLGGLAAAAAFVFVSYAGVTKIAAIAEEVRDPGRTIPRGILLSLGLMALLYAAVAFVLTGVVPVARLAHEVTPIGRLGAAAGGPLLAGAVAVVAVLALVSEANATLLAASRFPFAMARDRLLPAALGSVHPRLLTPIGSIAGCALFMLFATLFLDVVKMAKLASGFQILVFCCENFALIVFRETGASWYRPAFRAPLYPLLPIAGIAGGLGLLVALGRPALLGIALFAGVAAGWHLVYGRRRVSRRGLLQQAGRRGDLLEPAPARLADPPIPEARVVVALFGKERSPEALFEIGAALRPSTEARIDVLNLRELPAQTELAGAAGEDDRVRAVRRRVLAVAGNLGIDTTFVDVITHDARAALYEQARAAHCEWVIVGYRRRRHAVFVGRPLQWILHHLPASVVVFRDAGVRVFRRIEVVTRPRRAAPAAVRAAAALARLHGGRLLLVDVVPPGTRGRERARIERFHARLARRAGVEAETRLLEGEGFVEPVVRATAAADLIVLPSEDDPPLRRMFVGSASDRIAERAHCSVIQLRARRPSRSAREAPGGPAQERARAAR